MTPTSETSRNRRRALMVLGATLVVLIAVAILLGTGGGLVATSDETTSHQADAVSLDLEAPGNVEVVVTDGETITVETRIRDPWGRVSTEERIEDDNLIIETRCAVGWLPTFNDCRADYRLLVPTATPVSGSASNGSVEVEGLAAPVDLSTSNGNMSVNAVEGRVSLQNSNGEVEVVEVSGDVEVETSNGAVDVIDVSGTVDVTTSNGAIEVSQPVGDLRLENSNGGIVITGARSTNISATTNNDPITMSLASHPERVDTETTNGRIEISLPQDPPAYAHRHDNEQRRQVRRGHRR